MMDPQSPSNSLDMMMSEPTDMVRVASPSKHQKPLTNIEDLPTEVLQTILCRLPAKQVVSLRSVCKFWKASISNADFLELHLKNSRGYNVTEVLIEKKYLSISTSNDTGYSSYDMEFEALGNIFGTEGGRFGVLADATRIAASHLLLRMPEANYRSGITLYTFQLEAWRKAAPGSSSIGRSPVDFLRPDTAYNAGAQGTRSTTRSVMSFSAFGLVVFHHEQSNCAARCVILNPLTQEKVTLIIDNEDAALGGQVYGLFPHPIQSHTCVLWGQRSRHSNNTIEFKVLDMVSSQSQLDSPNWSIGKSSSWRNIIPRLHRHHPRRNVHSRGVVPPVFLNNVLYWMIDDIDITCKEAILAFDVQQEKFEKLPDPGTCCEETGNSRGIHRQMHLLQTSNGILSLCEFSTSFMLINIWVGDLSGKGGQWIRKHKFTDTPSFTPGRSSRYGFRPIGMVDEENVLVERAKDGLYILNLNLGTKKLLEGTTGDFMSSHAPSFATLIGGRPRDVIVQVPPNTPMLQFREDVIY